MWKCASAAGAAFLALSLSNGAQADSSDAFVGAIVGAGFGAAIGHGIDGRHGALLGSAIGAMAGSAIVGNDSRDRRGYRDNYGYTSTQVSYVGQPVYAQPVYAQPVYAQPVYAQAVYAQPVYQPVYTQSTSYYPAQPVRVIYSESHYRDNGWRNERRDWRDDRRDDRNNYREDRYRDRRWD